MNENEKLPDNPILNTALNMLDSFAPGMLEDPEQAFKELVPRLRYVTIEKMEKPSMNQLKSLQGFDAFEGENLVGIRKMIQGGASKLGPIPLEYAEVWQSKLAEDGFDARIVELTADEQEARLDFIKHPPEYFRKNE